MLATDEVEGGLLALDSQWALPVPNFRTTAQMEHWHTSAVAQEKKIVQDLQFIRQYEGTDSELLLNRLDEVFPQHTEQWCNNWYGGKCPAWAICWEGVRPSESELYQIKEAYEPVAAMEEE